MSDTALVKIRRHGDLTIPSEFREELGMKPGDYVVMRPMQGGLLLTKPDAGSPADRARTLDALVAPLWRAHAELGITDDEQLDALIEAAQEKAYRERYGNLSPSDVS